MPIVVRCKSCGKKLKAPDSAAGKRAKCPGCGKPVKIPERVVEAEEIPPEPYESENAGEEFEDYDGGGDEFDDPYGFGDADLNAYDSPSVAGAERRPCPMCGEMIVATAVKCRYCGEVFDATLKKSVKGKKRGRRNRETIHKFRREIHGLAGVWIFFGVVAFMMGIAMATGSVDLGPDDEPGVGVFLVILALLWLTVGVFAALKHLWAVYVGLVVTCLSLLGNLLNFNLCGLVICGCIIGQSIRVIKFGREMQDAGVPLTSQP